MGFDRGDFEESKRQKIFPVYFVFLTRDFVDTGSVGLLERRVPRLARRRDEV